MNPETLNAETLKALRKPFPPELVGRLPKTPKRPELDFVGHAAVTDRLNECAPGWSFAIDERFEAGGDCWVQATLTIEGVSRSEYGDGPDPKQAVSNALRRAAMRFGVALDLWSKEDLLAALQGVEGEVGDRPPKPGGIASDAGGSGSSPSANRPGPEAYGEGANGPGSSSPAPDTTGSTAGASSPFSPAAGDAGEGVGTSVVAEAPPPPPGPNDPISDATLLELLRVYGTPGKAVGAARRHLNLRIGRPGELTESQGVALIAAKEGA